MTTHLSALTPASSEGRSFRLLTIAAFLAVAFAPLAQAQAPAAAAAVAAAPSPAELEKLVDRIALYPDDLVTIILPASTNPLQLVQADRYLEKRKKDPKLPLDDKWDDAVKSLLNYPDVVKMMSADLDWTAALGEAVVANQRAVLDAVQAFRRKTQAAGNLKTDAKQVVVIEKEVIKIVPADPQVIYVPQYNPTTVVVYGGYSSWGYYPTPYPVYYYPYPPGAAFATGLIWGAAIGAAWSGNHYGWGSNNDININNSTNISGGGGNTVNRPGSGSGTGSGQRPGAGSGAGSRPGQQPAGGGSSQWKPNKQPGQVSGSIGKPSGGRVGDAGSSGIGGASRPSTQPAGGGGSGAMGGGSRPSTQPAGGGRDSGGGAFGGSSASGRQTQMDSSRGASSRNSMSGGSGSRAGGGYSGGGGARAGGGGGGGRGGGGGGGRGGGGRR